MNSVKFTSTHYPDSLSIPKTLNPLFRDTSFLCLEKNIVTISFLYCSTS